MTERTFMLFKPESIKNHNMQDIIIMILQSGLTITDLQFVHPTKELLRQHYYHLTDQPFYAEMENYLLKGPLVSAVLNGENAVIKWRNLMGATNPLEASEDTIRGQFGTVENGKIYNVVHGSDSVENAEREIKLWYGGLIGWRKLMKFLKDTFGIF